MLELQRGIGNAALTRTLARSRLDRLKKKHEGVHLQLKYAIEDVEHFRELLAATQVRWNEYHVGMTLLTRLHADVDPKIEQLKGLYADIGAEVDPDAKVKLVPELVKEIREKLEELTRDGQDADIEAVTKAYNTGKAQRTIKLGSEKQKLHAASAAEKELRKAQQAELEVQTKITDTGVTPQDAGPAFLRPARPTGRDALHTWITLSWKPFRNMDRAQLDHPKCFVYHLSKAQIETLIARLGSEIVADYSYQGWPTTRPALVDGVDGLVLPVQLQSMRAKVGVEILIDWIVPNRGHTAPAARLVESFGFTADDAKFESYGGTVTYANDRIRYEYNTGRRLIVSRDRSAVITYYNGS